MRFLSIFLAVLVFAVPAAADNGKHLGQQNHQPAQTAPSTGGHEGDTSPGNSGEHKVVICHHAGPTKTITITVDEHAVPAHLGHGDLIGPCPVAEAPVPPVTTTPTVTTTQPTPAPTTQTEATPAPQQQVAHEVVRHKAKVVAPKLVHRAANAPQPAQAKAKGGSLPFTGAEAAVVAALGAALLAGGLAIRRQVW